MLYVGNVPISGKQVVRRLQKLGWSVVGKKGSHVKLRKGDVSIVVPVHGNHDLGLGLLKAIEKQAGEVLR
jgi:predicted RNA binding protein YcfA (HicA-like mRNA interferase family)